MYVWKLSNPKVTMVLSGEKVVETVPDGQPFPLVIAEMMVIWSGGGAVVWWKSSSAIGVARAMAKSGRKAEIFMLSMR
jgi:hypothetical protein